SLRLLDGGHGLANDGAIGVANMGDDGVGVFLQEAGHVGHAAAVDSNDGDMERIVGIALAGRLLGSSEKRIAERTGCGDGGRAESGFNEELTPIEEAHRTDPLGTEGSRRREGEARYAYCAR